MNNLKPNTIYNTQDFSWLKTLTISRVKVRLLAHAIERAVERDIRLPDFIEVREGQIVEVRTNKHAKPVVCVARIPYQFDKRKSLVLVWDIRERALRTAYLNWNHDNHSTLQRINKYE